VLTETLTVKTTINSYFKLHSNRHAKNIAEVL